VFFIAYLIIICCLVIIVAWQEIFGEWAKFCCVWYFNFYF